MLLRIPRTMLRRIRRKISSTLSSICSCFQRKMAATRCRKINDLPLECIANVLSLTTPKHACRMCVVNSTFRSVPESDELWERFLPSDYRDIISRSTKRSESLLSKFQSKKDLYLHLSDHPILIDSSSLENGILSFKIEKWSGKKCYMLVGRRGLYIPWGQTNQSPSHPMSWLTLSQAVEVRLHPRVEIHGFMNTKMLTSGTNYAAYLVFRTHCRKPGFRFISVPTEACVGIKTCVGIKWHETEKRTVFLNSDGAQRGGYQDVPTRRGGSLFNRSLELRRRLDRGATKGCRYKFAKWRVDAWMEVELGEYFVKGGEDDMEIVLLEAMRLSWRRDIDLIIKGIEIRPKECTYIYFPTIFAFVTSSEVI